jgi:transposase InsO family protein
MHRKWSGQANRKRWAKKDRVRRIARRTMPATEAVIEAFLAGLSEARPSSPCSESLLPGIVDMGSIFATPGAPDCRPATSDDVEFRTLEWVAWFNQSRLLGPIGNIPPIEFEAAYHCRQQAPRLEAGVTQ